VAVYDRNATTFRPLLPEPIDQGDPFLLEAPSASGAMHRFYVYATGPDPENGWAFPLYGSDDLSTWRRIGMSLQSDRTGSHWAPCVRYVPALARPWVMLYSSAVGFRDEGHIGHTLRRADAERPEGPFVESGEVLTPDLDFAIDADVYRMPDGGLRVAYAMDFVEDEPYGTGIVEAPISDDLTTITGERRLLARPQFDWHVYDAARVMPWKTIPGIDWSRRAVRWHTVEAPVGGIVSPGGRPVYLYSGGCFFGFYAVGALVEENGVLHDVTDGEHNFVVRPEPVAGFFGPGHCSYLRVEGEGDLIMLHARFGSADSLRQMCLGRLVWTDGDLPTAIPYEG